jgi:hypothetical protein
MMTEYSDGGSGDGNGQAEMSKVMVLGGVMGGV